MDNTQNRIAVVAVLFICTIFALATLTSSGSANETKTAYTRDGINFVSKERVEENIRFEYAKPGEYREVAVPLDAIVVGASTIPKNLTAAEDKDESTMETETPAGSNQTVPTSNPENKYPYASISIGLLAIGGILFFVASFFSRRNR